MSDERRELARRIMAALVSVDYAPSRLYDFEQYATDAIAAADALLAALDAERKERDALAAQLKEAREFIGEIAGMDCREYHAFLSPQPCGKCLSCRARAALAKEPTT